MSLVADEQDLHALSSEALGLQVHLGDERAGRVDRLQPPITRLGVHRRGHTVSGEDNRRPLGDLVELLHEDRTALLEPVDDVLVVDDLLAHIDGGTVEIQSLLYRHHGAVDARAVAARSCEEDFAGHISIVWCAGRPGIRGRSLPPWP